MKAAVLGTCASTLLFDHNIAWPDGDRDSITATVWQMTIRAMMSDPAPDLLAAVSPMPQGTHADKVAARDVEKLSFAYLGERDWDYIIVDFGAEILPAVRRGEHVVMSTVTTIDAMRRQASAAGKPDPMEGWQTEMPDAASVQAETRHLLPAFCHKLKEAAAGRPIILHRARCATHYKRHGFRMPLTKIPGDRIGMLARIPRLNRHLADLYDMAAPLLGSNCHVVEAEDTNVVTAFAMIETKNCQMHFGEPYARDVMAKIHRALPATAGARSITPTAA